MVDTTLYATLGDSLRYDLGGVSTAAFRQPTSPGQGTTQRGIYDPSKARTWAEMNTPEGFRARYGLILDGDATKGFLQGESFVPDYVERYYRHESNPGKLKNHTSFTVDQVSEQDLKTVLIGGAAAYKHVLTKFEALFKEAPWKGTSKPIGPVEPSKPVEPTKPIEPTAPTKPVEPTSDPRNIRIAVLDMLVTQLKSTLNNLTPSDDVLGTVDIIKSWSGDTTVGKGRIARLKRLARYIERVSKIVNETVGS